MLERKCLFEPRIEHAMWKNEIGNGRARVTPPCREAEILPDPVYNHAIVGAAMRAQPWHERRRIAITASTSAKRVYVQIDILDPSCRRIIQHDDVDLMTSLRYSATEPSHRRSHTADAGIERVRDLQNLQRARQRSLPFAENI